MRTNVLNSTLLTLALLAAAPAFAADKPKKEASFGKGTPTGATLTREQLRACMTQQARVAQQDGDVAKEEAALVTGKAEIMRSGDVLKERLDTLDRTKPEEVAAYNEQTQARDKAIDDFQARVAAFNTRVEAAKVDREAFVKGCGNRRYFEDDEAAIKAGK